MAIPVCLFFGPFLRASSQSWVTKVFSLVAILVIQLQHSCWKVPNALEQRIFADRTADRGGDYSYHRRHCDSESPSGKISRQRSLGSRWPERHQERRGHLL